MSSERDRHRSMTEQLKVMARSATGVCQQLLLSVLCVTPHSMATERAVSRFNVVRSTHRLSMQMDTVNDRLIISGNSVGTAAFDPPLRNGALTGRPAAS